MQKKCLEFSRYYSQFKFHIQFYFTRSVFIGMFRRHETVIRDFLNRPTLTRFYIVVIDSFYNAVVI